MLFVDSDRATAVCHVGQSEEHECFVAFREHFVFHCGRNGRVSFCERQKVFLTLYCGPVDGRITGQSSAIAFHDDLQAASWTMLGSEHGTVAAVDLRDRDPVFAGQGLGRRQLQREIRVYPSATLMTNCQWQ